MNGRMEGLFLSSDINPWTSYLIYIVKEKIQNEERLRLQITSASHSKFEKKKLNFDAILISVLHQAQTEAALLLMHTASMAEKQHYATASSGNKKF